MGEATLAELRDDFCRQKDFEDPLLVPAKKESTASASQPGWRLLSRVPLTITPVPPILSKVWRQSAFPPPIFST